MEATPESLKKDGWEFYGNTAPITPMSSLSRSLRNQRVKETQCDDKGAQPPRGYVAIWIKEREYGKNP